MVATHPAKARAGSNPVLPSIFTACRFRIVVYYVGLWPRRVQFNSAKRCGETYTFLGLDRFQYPRGGKVMFRRLQVRTTEPEVTPKSNATSSSYLVDEENADRV